MYLVSLKKIKINFCFDYILFFFDLMWFEFFKKIGRSKILG